MRARNAISRFFLSPLTRLSFGLVMLTLSVMFASEFIGLVPDSKQSELQTRKVIAEMLALQMSTEVRKNKNENIQALLDSTKKRNPQLLSVAVRSVSGEILASTGAHKNQWTLKASDRSSPTQIQVALFEGKQRWGSVELRFAPLGQPVWQSNFHGSFAWLLIFMALSGFMAYRFFLKRALRELNPDSVIPERVRKALDTLTEGLLLVDNNDTIIFANQAFAQKTGYTSEQLMGKESSSLDWQGACLESSNGLLPWLAAMQGQPVLQGARLQLITALKVAYTFHVNISPISGGKDSDVRGVLITFDDVTALELKNAELQETLDKLQESKREIVEQNKTLLNMATRDPLTQSLNRRSLFESFDALFAEMRQEDGQMACIMVDIDHFKKVNDTYGHAVGDEAIKFLANTLSAIVRAGDLVGRMGGEEFVVVLPNIEQQTALSLAERMRKTIELSQNEAFADMPRITSSFGVAMLSDETLSGKQLIDAADKALYVAKKSGRNRVVLWSEDLADLSAETAPDTAAAPQEITQSTEVQQAPAQPTASEKLKAQPANTVYCPPDKVLLLERIHQAMTRVKQYQSKIALLVLDVDVIKRVSDTLGTLSAEKFAKTLITRIKQTLQEPASDSASEEPGLVFSVTRLNGSEMVILLDELPQSALITTYIYRIFAVNDHAVQLEGHEFFLSFHMGVSVYPAIGQTADELLSHAGIAMQEAKRKPDRNSFQFYSKELGERAMQQIQLEADLHRAVEREELTVYYQPRFELKNGRVSGMEALVRWSHPQLGMVSPDEFIPMAEQTGLIHKIGQWLVRSACLQTRLWQDMGLDVPISINLSPVEFRNAEFADEVIALVRDMGVKPDKIDFEIKETVVLHNVDTARSILEKLHHAGFGISLDDFGTGHSSLSYLKNFPVRKIKIDNIFIKDFINNPSDAAIVSALITMSHSLALLVVAEGVETEEQLRFLQDLRCDEVQGYFFAGALSSEKASNLLLESSLQRRLISDYQVDQSLPIEQSTGRKKAFGRTPRVANG